MDGRSNTKRRLHRRGHFVDKIDEWERRKSSYFQVLRECNTPPPARLYRGSSRQACLLCREREKRGKISVGLEWIGVG